MGLALGILMTVFLLGLILVKGVDVFWPHKVAELTLADGQKIAGIKTIEREAGQDDDRHQEAQYFVGNRKSNGFSFKFLRLDEITSTAYPKDIVVAERMEYGDAIFYPLSLTLADGSTIDSDFSTSLRKLVDVAADRRDEIKSLERDEIGALNRKIAAANLEIRSIQRSNPGDTSTVSALEAEIKTYDAEYQTLADKAAKLRQSQGLNKLTYRLPSGEEITAPVGDIVAFHFPNRLSTGAKISLFCSNLWHFIADDPREANTEGGIFPAIFGTFVMTLLMSIAVTPFGVVAAIYLREYAKQGVIVQAVRISVNNLAGVPSIVFGVFGLGFFIYILGDWVDLAFFPDAAAENQPVFKTGGILWASLTLAIMTLPVIIVATEEALAAVPRGVREAALACGASRWQTIQRIVLPSATPGILTGVILAMARGAGEVAPLMLVGVIKVVETLPVDAVFPFIHPERKFMHLGFHIYDLGFQSPDSEAAKPMVFATTFLLILLVVVMNLAAILLRNHLRKKYAMASF
ncbi:MAG: phosphate ABC transporter permease PstA [Verrucomicrobiales bacterium]|nr:phosphate ABC transporter permease PstA [Verrucomicrobiales bacterium]